MSSIDNIINSSNRVVGLMSGIDTDAQIKKLLSAAQTKVDMEKQKKQILEWKRNDYRDINTKLLAVRNSLTDLKMSGTFNAKKVTSSNENTVTATANGDAIAGIYDLKVKQAATRVSFTSTAALGSGDKTNIATQFGLANDTKIIFTIQGKDGEAAFNFDAQNATMDKIVTYINDKKIGVNAYYDETLDRFFLTSTDYGKSAEISVKVDSVTKADGTTSSFLKDYLKLDVYSGGNKVVKSSKPIATTPPTASDTLASLYGSEETIPTTPITFTLQGSKGKSDFSFNTDSTIQQFIDGINLQQSTTGITASYDATSGLVSLNDVNLQASLSTGSTATTASLNFTEPLYTSSDGTSGGTLTALTDGQDITGNFTYTGSGTLTSAVYHLNGDGTARVDFTVSGAAANDTIQLKSGTDSLFDSAGNQYTPQALTLATGGTSWTYPTSIAILKDTQNFLSDKLNLVMDENKGTGAIIDYNDATNLEFDSNKFTLNNINYTIASNAVPGTAVSLTVTNDIDKAVDKVKAFVDAYNTAMSLINTKLSQTREIEDHAVKYKPLTDDQKEAMTDDEITKWETEAKKGLMKNETLLQSTASRLRSIASTFIQDKVTDANVGSTDELVDYVDSSGNLVNNCQYRSLSSIGITTGSWSQGSTDNAKLTVNENQLRAALTADPDAVSKLFNLTQTDTTATTIVDGVTKSSPKTYSIGIAQQLYDTLTNSIGEITTKAGSDGNTYDTSQLGYEIYQEDDRIDILLDRMQSDSDRYYNQFAAMEEALQKLSTQSSWIAQQMGTSSSS